MCERFEVEITPQASEQIRKIRLYVSNELCMPMAANRLINKLEHEILSLSTMPERIPLVSEEPWHSKGIRKMVAGKHIIYFLIFDELCAVRVIAVVYERQDQKRQLEETMY